MEKLENFTYQKLNYQTYQQRLRELEQNEKLQKIGFQRQVIATTIYHYPIDYIKIGKGEKDLFLVGGTHGSETIGIDFLLNFIPELPNMEEFDPNLFTLHIIPLQNPEGFDISSNTLKNIPEPEFQNQAYEYYLRYRTDSIIVSAIKQLNLVFDEIHKMETINQVPANLAKCIFIHFVQDKKSNWNKLSDKRVMPNIKIWNEKIRELYYHDISTYQELKFYLLKACNDVIDKLNLNDIHDQFLQLFLSIIKDHLASKELWTPIQNEEQLKLYQQMFRNLDFQGLSSLQLSRDTLNMYQGWNHPKGSQIGHDATGTGINLNANHLWSPGIDAIRNQQTIYGPFVKNNIKNYTPGPLGIPTLDVTHFEQAIENKVLEDMIETSYNRGTYLATLLYHGTGGQIFYRPYESLMEENTYQEIYQYNEELATIYQQATDYQLLSSSSSTGYGDYLRRIYPGVLLIELSKMGGNPIGPYGDKNNTYRVFADNTNALKSLFHYFTKTQSKKR